ncbi:MAG TPA: type II secretion system protein [Pseudonocardiaceae bacterium]|jgi:type II secretory pathway pseudopilin PulG
MITRLRAAAVAGDRGESLLEVLIAVAIMGTALVAIVGSLVTAILVSDIHRRQATAGTAVRDYGEAIENAVAGGGYVGCATAASYASPGAFAAPAGYTKSVVAGSLRYWSGGAWQTSCTTDSGLQQLTIQVASDDGRATERLALVLRKPCRLSDSPC